MIGTAGHATTSISREENPANDARSQGVQLQLTTVVAALVAEALPPLASPPVLTSALVTGTAPWGTVELTTLPAALAASSVVPPKRTLPPEDLTPTCPE